MYPLFPPIPPNGIKNFPYSLDILLFGFCYSRSIYKTQRPRRVYLFHQAQGTIVVFVHEDGDVVGTAGGGDDDGVFYASTKEKGGGKGEEDVF